MSNSIIVLGWGSLIWNPKELKLNQQFEWQEDGPKLPIEFARISNGDRLTLVRKMDAAHVPVLWHEMDPELTLDEAIENLRIREGCKSQNCIGFVDLGADAQRSKKDEFASIISEWAKEKGIEKVIWTDLGVKFLEKTGKTYSYGSAIEYLKSLQDSSRAREYIENAPIQIRTHLKKIITSELGWGK